VLTIILKPIQIRFSLKISITPIPKLLLVTAVDKDTHLQNFADKMLYRILKGSSVREQTATIDAIKGQLSLL
jgi:hypothetical protein